jgi:L-rhamnose mutarotase
MSKNFDKVNSIEGINIQVFLKEKFDKEVLRVIKELNAEELALFQNLIMVTNELIDTLTIEGEFINIQQCENAWVSLMTHLQRNYPEYFILVVDNYNQKYNDEQKTSPPDTPKKILQDASVRILFRDYSHIFSHSNDSKKMLSPSVITTYLDFWKDTVDEELVGFFTEMIAIISTSDIKKSSLFIQERNGEFYTIGIYFDDDGTLRDIGIKNITEPCGKKRISLINTEKITDSISMLETDGQYKEHLQEEKGFLDIYDLPPELFLIRMSSHRAQDCIPLNHTELAKGLS